MAWACSGGMEKRAAGTAHLVDDFFGELDDLLVGRHHAVAHQIDEPRPSAADAEHPIAFAKRPDRQGPDRRVQSGHITATGQDSNGAFSVTHIVSVGLRGTSHCKHPIGLSSIR